MSLSPRRLVASSALIILLSLAALVTVSCTTLQASSEDLKSAGEMKLRPNKRIIVYEREGDTQHFYQRDCSGKFCENPPDAVP